MLIERYFETVQLLLREVTADVEPVRRAAGICTDALTAGGAIHIYDSGHMVSRELVRRAGGLVAFSALSFSLNVESAVLTRPDPPPADVALQVAYIEHLFDGGKLRRGDVLFVGSVSGKTAGVVELALQARAHGLTVIALTAVRYSSQLASEHPKGLRLFEAADLVLDNHAPYGDAMMEIDGLDYRALPASGIGAAIVLWAVTAGIIEALLARGLQPTVYPSVNLPSGVDLVRQVEARAREKGY